MNLNAIANNIANVNTTGFKRSKIEFQDILYQNHKPKGGDSGTGNATPSGIELGNGTQVVSTSKIFTQGQLTQTGERLDIAIEGDGFLEVLKPDGTSAYSRDGALKVGPDGQVLTATGLPVQSGFQAIPINATAIFISASGDVTIETPDGAQNFRLQLTRFNNPGGLDSQGGNILIETTASGTPETGNPGEDGFGVLHQGFLELSNVNVVEEMVNMIVAQRAYEINSKAIQTSDDMLSQIARLKR